MVEVVVAAEEKFGVKIPDDEVQNLKTVGDAVSYILTALLTHDKIATVTRPDVVVTGLGATTPLGGDVASTWDAMLAGTSGVRPLTQEWAAQLPVRIAAQLTVEPTEVLDRVKLRRLDRSEALALIAAHQAWIDAGLADSGVDPERVAVSVGSGIGGAQTLLAQDDILEASGARRVSPHTVPMLMPNGPAAWVGLELGARAGVHSVASACATGAEAIALGLDIIRSGRADVVVAGGTEAVIHPLPIAGFASMRAMSTRNDEPERASRPWDKAPGRVRARRGRRRHRPGTGRPRRCPGRPGATPGSPGPASPPTGTTSCSPTREGAGAAGRSRSRCATPTSPRPTSPTSTRTRRRRRSATSRRSSRCRPRFGDHPVLTATKSMTGHLLGAAGAIESIATILAIRDSLVPPTINLDDPDDALDLDVAADKARHLDIPAALNNSFGFGGHNVALIFTRYP